MAVPATRTDFKAYCLRNVGDGAIQINVTDDQVEDRIDEALRFFQDYHFDGSERVFYKYAVTDADKVNKYITLPDNIIGVVNVFPVGLSLTSNNMFNIRYQIALNDLYDLTSASMTPYYLAMQNIQFLEQMLVGMQPLRYNKHVNKLYLDMDWQTINTGEYIVVECYQIVDPDTNPKIWGDRWLQRYAIQLIKRQFGTNLTKFESVNLPGGNRFNATKIYNDADKAVQDLEQEMVNSWSIPASMTMG